MKIPRAIAGIRFAFPKNTVLIFIAAKPGEEANVSNYELLRLLNPFIIGARARRG